MLFDSLQHLLRQCSHAVFTGHIHNHSGLPGPHLQQWADAMVMTSLLEKAHLSHFFLYQNWRSLNKDFSLSQTPAKQVIAQCSDCQCTDTSPPPSGVNPSGLTSNEIWHMDVTHMPPLAGYDMFMSLY